MRRMIPKSAAQIAILFAVTVVTLPGEASDQDMLWAYPGWIESEFSASQLTDYEWANWLVGEWTGWALVGEDKQPQHQVFRITDNGRYLVTELTRGTGPDAYTGMGIFGYDTEHEKSYGEWFGGVGDRNDGIGRRDGDRWIWNINRLGHKIKRTITRVDADHFTADSEIVKADGQIVRTREELARVN